MFRCIEEPEGVPCPRKRARGSDRCLECDERRNAILARRVVVPTPKREVLLVESRDETLARQLAPVAAGEAYAPAMHVYRVDTPPEEAVPLPPPKVAAAPIIRSKEEVVTLKTNEERLAHLRKLGPTATEDLNETFGTNTGATRQWLRKHAIRVSPNVYRAPTEIEAKLAGKPEAEGKAESKAKKADSKAESKPKKVKPATEAKPVKSAYAQVCDLLEQLSVTELRGVRVLARSRLLKRAEQLRRELDEVEQGIVEVAPAAQSDIAEPPKANGVQVIDLSKADLQVLADSATR